MSFFPKNGKSQKVTPCTAAGKDAAPLILKFAKPLINIQTYSFPTYYIILLIVPCPGGGVNAMGVFGQLGIL